MHKNIEQEVSEAIRIYYSDYSQVWIWFASLALFRFLLVALAFFNLAIIDQRFVANPGSTASESEEEAGWSSPGKNMKHFFFLKSINAYKRPIFCILYKSRVSLLWRFVCGLYKCPVFGVVNSIASTLEDTNKVATAMLRQRVELEKCWLFFNLVEARTSFDDKQHIAFSMQCVLSAWLLNPPRTDGRFPLSAATMLEALAPIGELHSSKELSGVGRAEMSESWVHGSINSDFRPLWYHWNSLDSRSPPSLSLCFCLYPLKLRPLKFSWCNAFEKKQIIFFCNWWANDYPYDIFFLSARN